jgi:hypothetical protein
MSKHGPRVTLRQILQHAQHAGELCSGKTLPEILSNWQMRLAFERVPGLLATVEQMLRVWRRVPGTQGVDP